MDSFKIRRRKVLIALKKKLLGKHATGVVFNTVNGVITAPIDDYTIGRHLGFKGGWNSKEIDFLKGHFDSNDVVYIVGTHVGTLLVPIAKSVQEVVGYEANPSTFQYLRTNVFLNEVQNSRLYNYALGNTSKKIEFLKSTLNSGGSKIKPKIDSYLYNYDSPEIIEVDMISLDEHIESEGLPKPNHVVMDIEGSEFYALQGMTRTLQQLTSLYIEYVPHHLTNVSGTSNAEFFGVITPYFTHVMLLGHKRTFNLATEIEAFADFMDELYKQGKADDLLFSKTAS